MPAPVPDLLAAIEEIARRVGRRRFGAQQTSTARLARGIRETSRLYTSDRDPAGGVGEGRLSPAARLMFFTIADLPKLAFPLAELSRRIPASPRPLRILDLGAGYGAQTVGLLAMLDRPGAGRPLAIDALDHDGVALEILADLAGQVREQLGLGLAAELRTATLDLARTDPPGHGYDLIVAGSLLNELPGPRQLPLARRLLSALDPRGLLVVLEPALRQTARPLHRLRDALIADPGGPRVLAPCTHQGPCPMLDSPTDWCHERRPWDPPPGIRALASASGLRRHDLRWSYLALALEPDPRESLPWRVVSDPLVSKGKLELFLCGPGGRLRAVRLNRDRSPGNRPFQQLRRGHLAWLGQHALEGGRIRIGRETEVRGEDPAVF